MKGLTIATPPRSEWYPIGSIYISVNTTNPGDIFGGTWEQIKDKFILCSGDTYSNGSTGGEASVTLSTANIPAHTHTRGTMDITGAMNTVGHVPGIAYGISLQGTEYSGAFSMGSKMGTTYAMTSTSGADRVNGFEFTASKSWTGETSSVGNNEAFSNMPPYLAVTVWKRIQ